MATLLRVPEVAAGATEAVLSEWLVRENVPFAAGDPIVVIETEKASVEVEAETDAVLLRVLVSGGSEVEVGAPMALIGDKSELGADIDTLLAELGVSAAPVAVREAPARREVPDSQPQHDHRRIFISPLARRILKDAGLTADQVRGTGPNGRIIRRDVTQAVEAAKAAAPTQSVPPAPTRSVPTPVVVAQPVPTRSVGDTRAGYQEIPHTRLRRAVANRLTASKQSIPHFYLKRTAQIDALLTLRTQLNAVATEKISINDLVIRAVAVAHVAVPDANVIWTDDGMRKFESVDVGVAIASERGLVTPVLRGVERTSPSAIARQVTAYARQANDGKLRQSDLDGGSITVTNLGMYGVEEFAAIINPPQSAILAVGAGKPAPVVVDDAVRIATQLTLVMSVDHRAIDGALAAQWLDALVLALAEPLRLVA